MHTGCLTSGNKSMHVLLAAKDANPNFLKLLIETLTPRREMPTAKSGKPAWTSFAIGRARPSLPKQCNAIKDSSGAIDRTGKTLPSRMQLCKKIDASMLCTSNADSGAPRRIILNGKTGPVLDKLLGDASSSACEGSETERVVPN